MIRAGSTSVEMRGYMHDLAGSTEKEPTGRVSLLEDTDGDGRMDKATAFLDKVVMPRAVMAVNGGALIAVPPQLFFCKDTDGDGKADVKDSRRDGLRHARRTAGAHGELPGVGHGQRDLERGLRHAAQAARRPVDEGCPASVAASGAFARTTSAGSTSTTTATCSAPICCPRRPLRSNPLLRNATSINAKLAADQTLYASHPTPGVNRGYDAKTLSADGKTDKTHRHLRRAHLSRRRLPRHVSRQRLRAGAMRESW
jgi:hypothetical protein